MSKARRNILHGPGGVSPLEIKTPNQARRPALRRETRGLAGKGFPTGPVRRRFSNGAGFTLIELLVVISIIALLMAILMPTLQRVKKQARAVACQMNLRHWGLIWSMYCDENDGYFSSGIDIIDFTGKRRRWYRGQWIVALRPYYETRSDILRCPMATKPRPDGKKRGGPFNTYVMGTGGPGDRQERASYGQNNWLYHPPPDVEKIQQRPTKWNWRTVNVRGAGNIPVFADTMWRGGGPFYQKNSNPKTDIRIIPPKYNGQSRTAKAEMHHFCIDRHDGYINVLFMDWHTRKVGLKELWKLKWHRQFDINGFWTIAGGVKRADWQEHAPWMVNFKDY